MRKVTLSKGAALWEAGDAARNIAVLEKGTLGVKMADAVVGVAAARTVLGESAIFSVVGEEVKRTASLIALQDDVQITEYPAIMVKQAIDGKKDQVAPLILSTLVSGACRNLLISVSAQRGRAVLEKPLKALMQGLIEDGREVKNVGTWDEFMTTFRFLYHLRDYTESLRAEIGGAAQVEASVKASEAVRELFKGSHDVQGYLEELMKEEAEKDKWLVKASDAWSFKPGDKV